MAFVTVANYMTMFSEKRFDSSSRVIHSSSGDTPQQRRSAYHNIRQWRSFDLKRISLGNDSYKYPLSTVKHVSYQNKLIIIDDTRVKLGNPGCHGPHTNICSASQQIWGLLCSLWWAHTPDTFK